LIEIISTLQHDISVPLIVDVWIFVKIRMLLPLPKLTSDGYRIMLFRIFDGHTDVPPADHILKCMQIVFDLNLKYDKVRGTTLIYDFKNASTSCISSLIAEFKKLVMVQNVRLYIILYIICRVLVPQTTYRLWVNFWRKQKNLISALPWCSWILTRHSIRYIMTKSG